MNVNVNASDLVQLLSPSAPLLPSPSAPSPAPDAPPAPPPAPGAPPTPVVLHALSLEVSEATATGVAVVLLGCTLALVSVTIVLVLLIKRLTLVLALMRRETSSEVRAGLLNTESEPAPDAFATVIGSNGLRVAPSQNSAANANNTNAAARGSSGTKLARPSRREKSSKSKTDIENTGCGLEEIDEEDDHRL